MEASTVDAKEIGLRIEEVRRTLGLSVAAFARRIGAEPRTLYRLERGLNTPSVATVASIASVGATTSQWVIHGQGEGPKKPAEVAPSTADHERPRAPSFSDPAPARVG